LAPRGSSRALRAGALAALLWLAGASAVPAAPVQADTPQSLLNAARRQLSGGSPQEALETLRRLRDGFPGSPLVVDGDGLAVQCLLAASDVYRARYYLQRVVDAAPSSRAAFSSAMAVATYYTRSHAWLASLEFYEKAAALFQPGSSGTRADLDRALLHAAEVSTYQLDDAPRARSYLRRISGQAFPPDEEALYRQLRVRLLWSTLTAQGLGLKDSNVSSLSVDGDDVWVGTWNGGVARYSLSGRTSDPFPLPPFSRAIASSDRRIWIGTTAGLSWYGKGTGRWGTETDPASDHPYSIQVLRSTPGGLYVGTLGDGLFRQDDGGWTPIADGSLPGKFVTALAEDPARGRLLIGTMNIGLVILDLKSGAMSTLSEAIPSFTSENITTILRARDGTIWLGTYGEGLARWEPDRGRVQRFTRESGPQLGDNWILSSCETDRALYFGSFGGGVSILSKADGSWRRAGIRDGLASMDVAAIAWKAPQVFFGTLGGGVSVYDEDADGALP
jgi:tetratricopeptide (TPR) repeat protein